MPDLTELQRLAEEASMPCVLVADAATAKKLIAVALAAQAVASPGEEADMLSHVSNLIALRTALEELK